MLGKRGKAVNNLNFWRVFVCLFVFVVFRVTTRQGCNERVNMGSDENRFNALTLMKAFHKTVSVNHNLWREGKAEAESNRSPSAYQPNALPLGQAGSLYL